MRAVQNLLIGFITEGENSIIGNEFEESETLVSSNFLRSNTYGSNKVFDYIIVGSGPGAAMAAQKLDPNSCVLVIEQGGLPKTPPSRHHTLEHVWKDFYRGGQEIVFSPWLPQFAQAAVLGGGSEVNSGLYHDLPENLVDDFLSVTELSREEFFSSQNEVRTLLRISQMDVSSCNSPIARGAQGLGYEFQNIPRWRTYSEKSGFIQHGMIDLVWSRLGQKINFDFKLNTRVIEINVEDTKRVKILCSDSTGESYEYLARNLIVAAGSIQTPRLLCESGLVSWTKTNFQWHPMVRTIVNTPTTDLGLNDVDPFQAWTADKKFKFGSAVSTPGLIAMNLGRKPDTNELPKLRSMYGTFASNGRGGLLPKTSLPYYFPSLEDRNNLKQVRSLLEDLVHFSGVSYANPEQKVMKSISTVHIFGTLPLDSDVFIKGTSRLKIDTRIQVSDGSLLPFGPGVNPQGIIMSLCNAIITR